MRTIRWRNGQCPGRNGQWAERIAHAGSEAVRLVPFSSLPAAILDYLLNTLSQHGACRCAEMRYASGRIRQAPAALGPSSALIWGPEGLLI